MSPPSSILGLDRPRSREQRCGNGWPPQDRAACGLVTWRRVPASTGHPACRAAKEAKVALIPGGHRVGDEDGDKTTTVWIFTVKET
jgi:hypothetical protein